METEETVKEGLAAKGKAKRIWLAFVDIVLFTVLFMIFLFLFAIPFAIAFVANVWRRPCGVKG